MKKETRIRLKRLFGEGLMIVTSILLAFGIDAMWNQYQIHKEEQVALNSLQLEFESNLIQIDKVIAYQLNARNQVSELFMLSADEIKALPQKEVSEMMLSTSNPVTFNPILGTSKSLVDSGKFGIIQEQELRNAITTFLNLSLDIEEDVHYMKAGALDLWNAEIKHGGPWTDPLTERSATGFIRGFDFIPKATNSDLLNVREDKEFKSLVSRYHLNVGYYLSELEQLQVTITQILKLIKV
jgi:hypothetical protein